MEVKEISNIVLYKLKSLFMKAQTFFYIYMKWKQVTLDCTEWVSFLLKKKKKEFNIGNKKE